MVSGSTSQHSLPHTDARFVHLIFHVPYSDRAMNIFAVRKLCSQDGGQASRFVNGFAIEQMAEELSTRYRQKTDREEVGKLTDSWSLLFVLQAELAVVKLAHGPAALR